jgi:hypothetical protein
MKIGSKGCMDVVLGKARLSPLEVFDRFLRNAKDEFFENE